MDSISQTKLHDLKRTFRLRKHGRQKLTSIKIFISFESLILHLAVLTVKRYQFFEHL